jgi:hypothetical protein
MRPVESTIEIAAEPAQVWAVLIDFAAYPQWASFIDRIEGHVEPESRIGVHLTPTQGKPVHVQPTVVDVQPNRRLAWAMAVGHRTLFHGEHSFELIPSSRGTHLVQKEVFQGVIAAVIRNSPRGAVESFAAFNESLKQRVEGGISPAGS